MRYSHFHYTVFLSKWGDMGSKKRTLGEKIISKYRQSRVRQDRRETSRSEPQKTQADSELSDSGNKYADRILDVSLNGCRIITDAPLKVGDIIKVQSPFAVRGRVVWGQDGSYGIEFID